MGHAFGVSAAQLGGSDGRGLTAYECADLIGYKHAVRAIEEEVEKRQQQQQKKSAQ
jgi:hypothetical protein